MSGSRRRRAGSGRDSAHGPARAAGRRSGLDRCGLLAARGDASPRRPGHARRWSTGETTSRTVRLKSSRTPTTIMPTSTTTAPGSLMSVDSRLESVSPNQPPASASCAGLSPSPQAMDRSPSAPRKTMMPPAALISHDGPDDGARSTKTPATMSRMASSQAPWPKAGRRMSFDVAVEDALPRQDQRDQRDGAGHQEDDAEDRAQRCAARRAACGACSASTGPCARRCVAAVATGLRPRPRPGRPSAGVSSARTGTATGCP